MKILLVGDYGVIHTRRYLDLILKAGCDVVLLNTGGHITRMDALPAKAWRNWPRSGRRPLSYVLGKTSADKLGDFIVRLQLRWLWAKTQPDIAHVQWIDDKAWLVGKTGISPLILNAWGSDLNSTKDPNHDPVLLRQKAEVIAQASLLIADSQDMIEIASDLAGFFVRSTLLPIGIDTTLFKPGMQAAARNLRKRLKIPETSTVVLSPRAFRENYGHETIVDAFTGAIRRTNIDAYLVFKAYDCWDRSYIKKITRLAAEHHIEERIRIIEEMPYRELPAYYAIGEFAINFPAADAFPVTFIECLACELPVLTKRLPAYDSLGIAPYLRFTDTTSQASLESGISDMLSCVTSAKPDMTKARAYVSANFDEAVIADSLAAAYHRVLDAEKKY